MTGVKQARVRKAHRIVRETVTTTYEAGVRVPLRSPAVVAEYLAPRMAPLPVEEFRVLLLDAQHHLLGDMLVTRGLLDASLVHPREVFAPAIAHRAAAIILAHNHPSGDPTASAEDRSVTRRLVEAGRMLDIPVHDHVIIGAAGKYSSAAESGWLGL